MLVIMMMGFDEMITVNQNYTSQHGVLYGKSNVSRGGFHQSTGTCLTKAWIDSDQYKNSPAEMKSFMKRQQDSGQTVSIMQHLTLSEWFRPVIYKIQR
jgi:hypothetical protein